MAKPHSLLLKSSTRLSLQRAYPDLVVYASKLKITVTFPITTVAYTDNKIRVQDDGLVL